MNVVIKICYKSNSSKVLQHESFPLRGKKPEQIAYKWWKQIKREMSYRVELEEITCNEEQNITELVKELEKQEWEEIEKNFDLPF